MDKTSTPGLTKEFQSLFLKIDEPKAEGQALLAELLSYFSYVSTLNEQEILSQVTSMEKEVDLTATIEAKLKLAYLLSVSSSSATQIDKARTLAQQVYDNLETDQNVRNLSGVLISSFNLQKKRLADMDRIKEERDKLQQQLDALTDIEVKINERDPIQENGLEDKAP